MKKPVSAKIENNILSSIYILCISRFEFSRFPSQFVKTRNSRTGTFRFEASGCGASAIVALKSEFMERAVCMKSFRPARFAPPSARRRRRRRRRGPLPLQDGPHHGPVHGRAVPGTARGHAAKMLTNNTSSPKMTNR